MTALSNAFSRLWLPRIDGAMGEEYAQLEGPSDLLEAISHLHKAGGKRIRSLLFLAVLDALGVEPSQGVKLSTHLEHFHTFSLIQDDLPSMDDAPLRRGEPSVHRLFGEGVAILASDSLLGIALEVIMREGGERKLEIMNGLTNLLFPHSLVGGQVLDLALGRGERVEGGRLFVNALKTADLFEHTVRSAALFGGGDPDEWAPMGFHLGIVFQSADDQEDLPPENEDLELLLGALERHEALARAWLEGREGGGLLLSFLEWATGR
ncbi:polyprenyl synthetase family protein [bacterium]|nr:polyprenyl synthetase family protein [bacterium]